MRKRIVWFGAWSIVITGILLVGGIFLMAASGIKNVCESAIAKQAETKEQPSSEASSLGSRRMETFAANGEKKDKVRNNEKNMESPKIYSDIVLVNKEYSISPDYICSITALKNGQKVDSSIYEDLRAMLFAGEEENSLSFLVASGYRTKEEQEQLVQKEIEKNMRAGMSYDEAYEDTLLTVAPSGFSEHETGLAVDIVSVTNQRMDETQEYTAENQWLQENCYKYGFILRYPKGKEEITGFSYESWHFRYVGKAAAKEITEQGITLEEYLDRSRYVEQLNEEGNEITSEEYLEQSR